MEGAGVVIRNEIESEDHPQLRKYSKVDIQDIQLSNGVETEKHLEDYEIIRNQLRYPVDMNPSWFLSFLLGFQQYLIMFGATFGIPVLLAPALCIENNAEAKGELLNIMFVISGLSTLLQVFFGTKLPIIQSGSYVFFAVAVGILSKSECKEEYTIEQDGENVTVNWDPQWYGRLAELQGCMMVGSVLQLVLGGFGLVGYLLKVIGPITISVLITLIGLNLASVAASSASQNWGIAFMVVILITLFSEYLKNVRVPLPVVSCTSENGISCGIEWVKLFSSISIILSLSITWIFCGVLTAADVFPEGDAARVTGLVDNLNKATWFYIPYPGRFGMPTVTVGGAVGMFAGVLGGAIETLGDYYACARLSGAPPPPKYALNRGILMEGVGCFLAGLCGTGIGVTSYSENIGAIGLTKVGSRKVIMCSGILITLIGIFGKLGGLLAAMPTPIIGGMYLVVFGILSAAGISNMKNVDLSSSRNIFIFGVSMFVGLVVPIWSTDPANASSLLTGNEVFDQLSAVILKSGMIMGATIACFLDNTIPGTEIERGLHSYKGASKNCTNTELSDKIYREPLMEAAARKLPWLRRLPFVPPIPQPTK